MNSPDPKQISDFLHDEHLDDAASETPQAGDPVTETMMRLNLDQIKEYDHNPRRAPNKEYAMLKASLLKTGTDKVLLVVTRRPGEDEYFPAAGGNTRLRILKELYQELHDEKFYWLNCKFSPYQDEISLMIDHLAENDNRAEYVFIDRARAICELHEQLQEEAGGELSQRKFIDRLIDLGYPKLSQTHLIRYRYTTRLYEYIPQALDAGMGQRSIVRLHDSYNQMRAFFDSACNSDAEITDRLESVFNAVLSEHDDPDGIDFNAVVVALFSLMAPSAERFAPDLDSGELASRLLDLWKKYQRNPGSSVSLQHHTVAPLEQYQPERPGQPHRLTDQEIDRLGWQDAADSPSAEPPIPPTPDEYRREPSLAPVINPDTGWTRAEPSPDLDEEETSNADNGEQEPEDCLAQLWRHIEISLRKARHFAAYYGLDELIHGFPYEHPTGHGFWVDLPAGPIDELAQTAWWWLWDLSAIIDALRIGPAVIEKDPVIAASRFARQYQEAMGRETRNDLILMSALRTIEKTIPRRLDHSMFPCLMPKPNCDALVSLIYAIRTVEHLANLHLSNSG